MTEKEQAAAIAVGVAIGRRQAAERAAVLLRSVLAAWAEQIAGRGPIFGPLLAGMTRVFAERLEREAVAIEAQLQTMHAEERRLRADLEAAKVKPRKSWWQQ